MQLPATDLRPVLKSLLLSLLPALEDETSEDFERAIRIVESLERNFSPIDGDTDPERDGYYWQCLFLAVITSPARRQGALNLLIRRLPKCVSDRNSAAVLNHTPNAMKKPGISIAAETILSPEPGLLVRCFAAGLSDQQTLVQRGFLDLLVTHIPLDSPVLQSKVRIDDIDRLMNAAIRVLLRREMSLNRRLWSWFLGPESSRDTDGNKASITAQQDKQASEAKADRQYQYFNSFGRSHLERSILAMFERASADPVERARPFRICLSLMDRWEIGGSVVPHIFLPAMQNIYSYSLQASASDTSDVLRSASLFFDGVEAMLIWANLIKLAISSDEKNDQDRSMRMLAWILRHFNVKDEEMLTTHIPHAAILILSSLSTTSLSDVQAATTLDTLSLLFDIIPERVLSLPSRESGGDELDNSTIASPAELKHEIEEYYRAQQSSHGDSRWITPRAVTSVLWRLTRLLAMNYLESGHHECFGKSIALLLVLGVKLSAMPETWIVELLGNVTTSISSRLDSTMAFPMISPLVSLLTWLGSKVGREQSSSSRVALVTLHRSLHAQLWMFLSPAFPKYNVEAVKAIWQLHDHSSFPDTTEAALTALVRHVHGTTESSNDDEYVESIRRFIVLWNHTITSPSSGKKPSLAATRRASMMSVLESQTTAERQTILTSPLSLVLDLLNDSTGPAYDAVSTWIRSTSSLKQILQMQFDFLLVCMEADGNQVSSLHAASHRAPKDRVRDLEYGLDHFLGLIRSDNGRIRQQLGDIMLHHAQDEDTRTGLTALVEYCTTFVCDARYDSISLKRKSIDILLALLSSPSAAALKPLDLDSRMLDHLIKSIKASDYELQSSLLKLITLALSLRLSVDEAERDSAQRSGGSISLQRPPQAGTQRTSESTTASLTAIPPPQLLECLKLGFSSPNSRSHLDRWLLFLSNILPFFAESIFANLLPLIECFCKELNKVQQDIIALSKVNGSSTSAVPESVAMTLLDAIETMSTLR